MSSIKKIGDFMAISKRDILLSLSCFMLISCGGGGGGTDILPSNVDTTANQDSTEGSSNSGVPEVVYGNEGSSSDATNTSGTGSETENQEETTDNTSTNTTEENKVTEAKSTLKKTGQTTSYYADGKEAFGDYIKDDGYYQAGVVRSYHRENDIVTDNVTGLMWQDNKDVATVQKPWITQEHYDAKDYNNTSGDTATSYCANLTLGGYDDWRVPTIQELQTITAHIYYSPSIDKDFQNIIAESYWSSTHTVGGDDTGMWSMSFKGDTLTSGGFKTSKQYIRCVRK
ncbi:MAG: DUF1566 domain-containing protein [Campylobacterales bacterium]|nr:DUF1566 domain-containing protein [Campylobacterales bacterium]